MAVARRVHGIVEAGVVDGRARVGRGAVVTDEVRYRATQRAGLRGVGFELGLFVLYLALAPVVSRTTGGVAVWVAVAAGAVLLRLAVFSGPHHRGVDVTGSQVRAGRIALPLADVVEIEVLARRELRRRTNANEVENESVPPGPTEAVVVHLVSPEGLPTRAVERSGGPTTGDGTR